VQLRLQFGLLSLGTAQLLIQLVHLVGLLLQTHVRLDDLLFQGAELGLQSIQTLLFNIQSGAHSVKLTLHGRIGFDLVGHLRIDVVALEGGDGGLTVGLLGLDGALLAVERGDLHLQVVLLLQELFAAVGVLRELVSPVRVGSLQVVELPLLVRNGRLEVELNFIRVETLRVFVPRDFKIFNLHRVDGLVCRVAHLEPDLDATIFLEG